MTATTASFIDQLTDLTRRVDERTLRVARVLAEDFLGVAVAGSRTPEARTIVDFAQSLGRTGDCVAVGIPQRFDAPTAALINGTAGYSIGLTDTHTASITHPGPSVVPAALAVAESVGASGRDFLTAVIGGCEAVVRIGAVVNPSHRARGYHPTATCNVFGATFAAGLLMGLDHAQLSNAFGIAGSMASGIYEFRHEGAMLMALHGGWPAQNGVLAALLARAGFTGPSTVLEGSEGFFRAFSDYANLDLLAVDFDKPGIQGIGLRPYNACRYGHAGIDALQLIEQRHGRINPDDVARMTVSTHSTAVAQETEATSVIGARLSTKFTVAYALIHGPKIDEVSRADLTDPAVVGMIARTDVIEDSCLTAIFPEKWACRVRLELRDGTLLDAQVDTPKGEPANPMTDVEVSQKFHRLVDPVLTAPGADVAEARFLELVDAPNVTELCLALSGTTK